MMLVAEAARGIRPDAWDFPLLLHVLGAMLLVGALVLAASALILAWRDGSASLVRLGYRSLLIGALPAWIVMRGAAEWIADKEGLTGDERALLGGHRLQHRRLRLPAALDLDRARRPRACAAPAAPRGRAAAASAGPRPSSSRWLLIAYLVAIWAMTTKPV